MVNNVNPGKTPHSTTSNLSLHSIRPVCYKTKGNNLPFFCFMIFQGRSGQEIRYILIALKSIG